MEVFIIDSLPQAIGRVLFTVEEMHRQLEG